MSFSRYKPLSKYMTIISLRNIECNRVIGQRLYSDVLFSSPSPHKLKLKPTANTSNIDDKSNTYNKPNTNNESNINNKSNTVNKFNTKTFGRKFEDNRYVKDINNDEFTYNKNEDANNKEFVKPSIYSHKQSTVKAQNKNRFNHKLIDNPRYQQKLSYNEGVYEIESDHDLNISNTNNKSNTYSKFNKFNKSNTYNKSNTSNKFNKSKFGKIELNHEQHEEFEENPYLKDIDDDEFTYDENEDANNEEFVKPSVYSDRQSTVKAQHKNRFNHLLIDNPHYQQVLSYKEGIYEVESDHDLNVSNTNNQSNTHSKFNKSNTYNRFNKSNKFNKSKFGKIELNHEKYEEFEENPYLKDIDDDEHEEANNKEFGKPLRQTPVKAQNKPTFNHKLIDHPQYRQVLLSEKDVRKVESNDDFNGEQSNEDNSQILDSNYNEENKLAPRSKLMETSEGIIKYDLSADEFNIDKYVKELIDTDRLGPLDQCYEDISDFGPGLAPTFNFAAYADRSQLIQEYVKLGVKLYKVEKNMDHMRALLSVDLEKELPIYLQFFHDCGVPADSLGDLITKNPMILKEDLDDMKTRIRYLRAHDFKMENISRIVTKNPTWLTWATKHIDERLGHFQNEFYLNGPEVRFLATKQPKLITYSFKFIHENTYAVREEMGFKRDETKVLLLAKPRLWMNSRKKIVDSFDYLHNTMGLSHLMIVSQADLLTCRRSRLKNRHEFLLELKKVQYDKTKPGYIAPTSVVFGSDEEFCRDVAKTTLETYNLFLKTR